MTHINRRKLIKNFAIGSGLLSSGFWQAATQNAYAQTSQYNFAEWVRHFEANAARRGIDSNVYRSAMATVEPNMSVFRQDRSQPEFQEPIWVYLEKRVSEWRINTGRERAQQYAGLLSNLERDYGVDRFTLLSFWGMESAYGEILDNKKIMKPVLNSLSTLAWGEPRRRDYWERELINALIIIQRGWATPQEMWGSWAGAMGHTQWMPEAWLNIGVDYDRDGKINPLIKPDDALAGTARYMVERGNWESGKTWGYEVAVLSTFDALKADGTTWRTISEWQSMGIVRPSGLAFPRPDDRARLRMPAGMRGPAFLLIPNFYAYMRYNPSLKYAFGVGHLADRIRGGGSFIQSWPKDLRLLSIAELKIIQTRLNSAGFNAGPVDGKFGTRTQTALQQWQRRNGITPADGYPTEEILNRIR